MKHRIFITVVVLLALLVPSNVLATEESGWVFDISKQIDTDTYDGGPQLVKVGDNIQAYFGEWYKGHGESKGKIVRQELSAEHEEWSIRSTVYEHPIYDIGGVRGGLIDDNIYLFFAHYDVATTTWIDQGYIRSLDTTGMYWSGFISLPTGGEVNFEPLNGGLCETANSILMPWFGLESHSGGTSTVRAYKTTNRGETWNLGPIIYSGTTKYCEVALAYIGNNKVIAHMRNNDGGFLGQATSSDNGETWSETVETNLQAPTGVKIPFLFYDNGTLIEMFHDRGVGQTLMSVADAQEVFVDPTAWGYPYIINSGYHFSGYAQMVKTDEGYFATFSRDTSSTDADIYGGAISYVAAPPEPPELICIPTGLLPDIQDFRADDATLLIKYETIPHSVAQVLVMKAYGASSISGAPGFCIALDTEGEGNLSVYLGDGAEGTGQSLARTQTGGFSEGSHYLAIVFKRGEELLLYDNNTLTEIPNLVGDVAMETGDISTSYPFLIGIFYNKGGERILPFMGESLEVWQFSKALNLSEIQLAGIAIDEGYL